jgi:hypothetical protein
LHAQFPHAFDGASCEGSLSRATTLQPCDDLSALARRNSPGLWALVCIRFEIGSRVADSQRVRPLRYYGLLPDTRELFAKTLDRRPERSNKTLQPSSRAQRQSESLLRHAMVAGFVSLRPLGDEL